FPEDYSVSVLRKYSSSYRDMVENICEIVLTDALLHILVGKNLRDSEFGELDCLRIQNFLDKTELNEVRTQLKTAAVKFLEMYCEEGEEISQYLERAADNIAVRLKNAAENGALNGMLRVNQ
ncbi:MAG: DUF6179 domain-containing protein, partial [Bacillota bacterium]|nr:DUF6179 domain-containing protein [Bacillota bacterium]